MNKLSVIVPVYNAGKYLDRCLDSIINQEFTDLEIIVINDGSSDNSKEIIERYVEKDNRIVFIDKANEGESATRNLGMEIATGEYIAFVDSDDYIDKDMYKQLYEKIEEEKADIVFCRFKRVSENKTVYRNEINLKSFVEDIKNIKYFLEGKTIRVSDSEEKSSIIMGSVWRSLFKKRIIVENNLLFNTKLKYSPDLIFTLDYINHSQKACLVDEYFYNYFDNPKSLMRSYKHNLQNFQTELMNEKIRVMKNSTCYSEKDIEENLLRMKAMLLLNIVTNEMSKTDYKKSLKTLMKDKEHASLIRFKYYPIYIKQDVGIRIIILFSLIKLRLWGVTKYLLNRRRKNV